MFRKLDSVKALKTLIKLAAVALTSPATVAVASSLYPGHRVTQVVVSVAALVLVEGCLLLGWQMLDQHGKSATLTQRRLYASLTWVAYFALFGIALYHQEGLAGLAFRLTLGVMLVYASAEAGLLADLKRQQQADRDIYTDRVVKRYARRLSRKDAKAELDSVARLRQLEREARERQIQRQAEQAAKAVKPAETGEAVEPPKIAKLDGRSADSLDRANKQRKLSKEQAVERTFQLLAEQPGSAAECQQRAAVGPGDQGGDGCAILQGDLLCGAYDVFQAELVGLLALGGHMLACGLSCHGGASWVQEGAGWYAFILLTSVSRAR